MVASAPALADLFLRGAHGVVLGELHSAQEELTREVARLVGTGIRDDAVEHWNVCPRERTWVDHQAALLALARLPGVDQPELAAALTDAVTWQRIDGTGSPLEPEVFAWMMEWAPDSVYEGCEQQTSTGHRFLEAALWSHTGERAIAWMVDRYRTDPIGARFDYDHMRVGWMRSTWSPEQWNTRAHALCDAKLAENPFPHLNDGLPPATSAAQVRVVCTYAKSPTDWALRTTAERVRGYASGDARKDVGLFWWDLSGTTTELLRWVLELSGPPGARAELAEAAFAEGLVDAPTRDFLAAEMPRPSWADGEVAWEVDEIVDAGSVVLPDGHLCANDPYWAFEGWQVEIDLPPGAYPVRVFKAIHPLFGRQCVAADVVVDPDLETVRWERAGVRESPKPEFGYRVEVGVGSFAAATALTDAPFHELAPEDFVVNRAAHAVVDAGELGSIVMFTVGPQHQLCRTWVGYAEDGRIARVLSDLGLIHLNPELHPSEPMRPGSPWDESVGPFPPGEAYRRAGVVRNTQWEAGSRGGLDDGTVTVLEVLSPEHNWLRTLAVWYRWDDSRAGNLLPADEFKRRFESL
jgi:hypothetical protein